MWRAFQCDIDAGWLLRAGAPHLEVSECLPWDQRISHRSVAGTVTLLSHLKFKASVTARATLVLAILISTLLRSSH